MMTTVVEEYRLPSSISENTTTGCESCRRNCMYVPSGTQNAIKKLQHSIELAQTDSLKKQMSSLCSWLSAGLIFHRIDRTLPEFHLTIEDDEVYLEWIFDYYRFGFDFYDDEERSGWFALIAQEDGIFRFNSEFKGDYGKAVEYILSVIGRES